MKVYHQKINERPTDLVAGFCAGIEDLPPEITLNGDGAMTLTVGNAYEELGAEFLDDCDEVELQIAGAVDTNTPGIYTISYEATDSSQNHTIATRTITIVPEYRGVIYLTFDDGPGAYTNELLDILKKYNVKATFFVTGAGDDATILREYQEGHAVGLHTASHNYAYIYQNMNNFFADLEAVGSRVKNITGEDSYLIRFPGGSSNTVSSRYDGGTRIMSKLASEVERRGYTYFDWNISSGDAGSATSADQVYRNVVSRLTDGGEFVVLQHDIKKFSVDAVERIINYGLSNGYTFKKLTSSAFSAHHGINN